MSMLNGKRLYVDTNIFIYLGEQHPVYGPIVRDLFQGEHAGNFFSRDE